MIPDFPLVQRGLPLYDRPSTGSSFPSNYQSLDTILHRLQLPSSFCRILYDNFGNIQTYVENEPRESGAEAPDERRRAR